MSKRDPLKTQNNKEIEKITEKLRALEPKVFEETGIQDNKSLNGIFGGKHADYIDIKYKHITSPDHYVSLYMRGFKLKAREGGKHRENLVLLRESTSLQEWLHLFLKRTYLRNIDSLARVRPTLQEASMFLGQNQLTYGLFVTPRKNPNTGEWENDKSEIRRLPYRYWSVGHILNAGIVDFQLDKLVPFNGVDSLLNYVAASLVSPEKSIYAHKLFKKYMTFIEDYGDPQNIPFLIPELRYAGLEKQHEYRLDFTIIFPNEDDTELRKIGIELSPWSTHGEMTGLTGKSQKEINQLAKKNFEKEMRKRGDYFLRYNIHILTYTDEKLQKIDEVWEEIKRFLIPAELNKNYYYRVFNDELPI